MFELKLVGADATQIRLRAQGTLGLGVATAKIRSDVEPLFPKFCFVVIDVEGISGFDAAGLAAVKNAGRHAREAGSLLVIEGTGRLHPVLTWSLLLNEDMAYRA